MTVNPAQPPTPAAIRQRFNWADFFAFRFMITPSVIRVIYLIGAVLITLGAILVFLGTPVTVTSGDVTVSSGLGGVIGAILTGLLFFILGQLIWRVSIEWLIVFFRIHESVAEIERRGQG